MASLPCKGGLTHWLYGTDMESALMEGELVDSSLRLVWLSCLFIIINSNSLLVRMGYCEKALHVRNREKFCCMTIFFFNLVNLLVVFFFHIILPKLE